MSRQRLRVERGRAPASGRPPTVVVIDDDAAVLDSFRFLLELAGFPVVTFASAVAFLAAGVLPPFRLIVDHHMPRMSGLDLAERLRRDGSDAPMMLITSAMSPAISERAARIGIRHVVEKPCEEATLMAFVSSPA